MDSVSGTLGSDLDTIWNMVVESTTISPAMSPASSWNDGPCAYQLFLDQMFFDGGQFCPLGIAVDLVSFYDQAQEVVPSSSASGIQWLFIDATGWHHPCFDRSITKGVKHILDVLISRLIRRYSSVGVTQYVGRAWDGVPSSDGKASNDGPYNHPDTCTSHIACDWAVQCSTLLFLA